MEALANETAEQKIARLEAVIAEQKAKLAKGNDLRIKVSEKGAVSVYGLGRWPVTLYKSQMIRFLGHGKAILEFIETHPELKEKE